MMSGRSDGFGTLLYQSDQFPEPGSSTSHIPEMSALCADAVAHQQKSSAEAKMILSVESEGIKRISRGHQYVLPPIDQVGLRSVRHLIDVAMPKDLSVNRIVGDQ